mmetsp:Transcript_25808/g.72262  ORF Transcript_25808/g.72262 Transcript_25808/m.72262 type:complete len:287 (+) Transcript_25808:522-1382(+)
MLHGPCHREGVVAALRFTVRRLERGVHLQGHHLQDLAQACAQLTNAAIKLILAGTWLGARAGGWLAGSAGGGVAGLELVAGLVKHGLDGADPLLEEAGGEWGPGAAKGGEENCRGNPAPAVAGGPSSEGALELSRNGLRRHVAVAPRRGGRPRGPLSLGSGGGLPEGSGKAFRHGLCLLEDLLPQRAGLSAHALELIAELVGAVCADFLLGPFQLLLKRLVLLLQVVDVRVAVDQLLPGQPQVALDRRLALLEAPQALLKLLHLETSHHGMSAQGRNQQGRPGCLH